jgi:hypothetical protein
MSLALDVGGTSGILFMLATLWWRALEGLP